MVRIKILLLYLIIVSVCNMGGSEASGGEIDHYADDWYPFKLVNNNEYLLRVHKGTSYFKNQCRIKIFKPKRKEKPKIEAVVEIDESFNKKGYIDGIVFLESGDDCSSWERYADKFVILYSDIDDFTLGVVKVRLESALIQGNLISGVDRIEKYKLKSLEYLDLHPGYGYKAVFVLSEKLYYANFTLCEKGVCVINSGRILGDSN